MKRIIVLLFAVVSVQAFGQTITTFYGGVNTQNYFRGFGKFDSLLTFKKGTADTLALKRLNLTNYLTGQMTGLSVLYTPNTAQNVRANVGLMIANRLFDQSATVTNIIPGAVQTNQYGAPMLAVSREHRESLGDTADLIYNSAVKIDHKYFFDPVIKTFDSAGSRQFNPMQPGLNVGLTFNLQGNNTRWRIEEGGRNAAALKIDYMFFDSSGTINTERPNATNNYGAMGAAFVYMDFTRSGLSDEKKVIRGAAGLAGYVSKWKAWQNIGGTSLGVGNYINRIDDFIGGGGVFNDSAFKFYLPGWTKAQMLGHSTVDTATGFRSLAKWSPYNEVNNGYGFVQEGEYDINHYQGKSYFGNVATPLKADADTTTARLIVKGKLFADTVHAVTYINAPTYWTVAKTTADQTTSSTSAVASTELTFSALANTTYEIEATVLVSTDNTTNGYGVGLTYPAGVTGSYSTVQPTDNVSSTYWNGLFSGVGNPAAGHSVLGGVAAVTIKGILITSGTAGSITVGFLAESGGTATIKTGSILKYKAL